MAIRHKGIELVCDAGGEVLSLEYDKGRYYRVRFKITDANDGCFRDVYVSPEDARAFANYILATIGDD